MAQKPDAEKLDLERYISDFFKFVQNKKVELYNEFSLQHELGIYLRNHLPRDYKVQFERNVSFFGIESKTVKKEIDIVIFTPKMDRKYAIELKYPRNGQHPEQMYAFVKDIRFVEQLQENGFIQACAVTLVEDKLFYSGRNENGIYQFFRGDKPKPVKGTITKPTGKRNESVTVSEGHPICWQDLDGVDGKQRKYYIVTIG